MQRLRARPGRPRAGLCASGPWRHERGLFGYLSACCGLRCVARAFRLPVLYLLPAGKCQGPLSGHRSAAFGPAGMRRSGHRPRWSPHAHSSRQNLQAERTRHLGQDRDPGRRHHLPDDGLHPVRQPDHPGQYRHAQGCGVRGHLCGVGAGHDRHGALRQLSHRGRPGHGPQRLLRLHRGGLHGLQLAGGAGRRVPVGLPVPAHFRAGAALAAHHRHPADLAGRHLGGYRALFGHHRPEQRGHRGGFAQDPGHAGRHALHPRAAGLAGLLPHRGA